MQEIFAFQKTGIGPGRSRESGMFRATGIRPQCAEALAIAGHTLPMEMFEHRQQVGGDAYRWRKRVMLPSVDVRRRSSAASSAPTGRSCVRPEDGAQGRRAPPADDDAGA